mgnify:FL=1
MFVLFHIQNFYYIYSATGEKLATNANGSLTYYRSVMVYGNDNKLLHILTTEGTVTRTEGSAGTSYTYNYFKKDQIGSTRAVLSAVGNTLQNVQSTDYYPFGLAYSTNNLNKNKYLFSGKELQDASIGGTILGLYDFGMRQYDAFIGRWISQDPKHEFHSPYVYCANNPINLIDPSGLSTKKDSTENEDGTWSYFYTLDEVVVTPTREQYEQYYNHILSMYNDLCSSNTYYQNFPDFQYENSYDIDINSWASTASKSTAVNVITHGIGIYTNLPKNRRTLDIYKQGKFPTTFHNKPVIWSRNFRGNQYVPSTFVDAESFRFTQTVQKLKMLGYVGNALSVSSILCSAMSFHSETLEENIYTGMDIFWGVISYLPGGIYASTLYYITSPLRETWITNVVQPQMKDALNSQNPIQSTAWLIYSLQPTK